MDGAASHLDITVVEAAESLDISLLCLPSNTTHELQPLDKSVFRSFEYHWDEEVLNYWSNYPERRITRARFGKILAKVYPKAMSPQNLQSGFRATGIYPYDPNAIPETAFAPSTVTYIPNPNEMTQEKPNKTLLNPGEENADTDSDQSNCSSGSDVVLSHFVRPKTSGTENTKSVETTITNDIHHVHGHLSRLERQESLQEESSSSSDSDIILSHYLKVNPSGEKRTERVKGIENCNGNKEEHEVNKDSIENQENRIEKCKSLTELFPTPEIKTPSVKRRKALNSTAQKVTRDLFNIPSTSKGASQPKKKRQEPKESWYCFVCQVDRVADMRLCVICARYAHEECVGLQKGDGLKFVCHDCEV